MMDELSELEKPMNEDPVDSISADQLPVGIFRVDGSGNYVCVNRWAFDSAPDGMALTGLNGDFRQVNRCLCGILGRSETELLALSFQEITHEDDRAASIAGANALLDGSTEIFEQEKRYLKTDGSVVWARIRTALFREAAGEPLYFLTHVQDITAKKHAAVALAEAEERFWQVVDLSNDGIVVHVDGKLVFANPAAARILAATSPNELIGKDVLTFVLPEYHEIVKARLRGLQDGAAQPSISGKIIRLDGEELYIESAAVPFVFNGNSAVQVIFRDVTQTVEVRRERERLFREVESTRDELRLLSQRLVQVQELERRRLARELHDEIGQELTALRLNIEQIQAAPADAARQSAQGRVGRLLKTVREMSLDLRPTMLDDLGLLPALLWHFDGYQSTSGIKVHFRHWGVDGQRFAPQVETAAYRIVQEGLTNVLRHAGVKEVQVTLWISEPKDRLTIQIEDQGAGFDLDSVSHARSSGVSGMRERATLLGGVLRIESVPREGTCLTAELPLEAPNLENAR